MGTHLIRCHKYYIFLIIIDGNIVDVKETIDEIVRATYLPISLIIVGLGELDFKDIAEID